MTVVLAMTGRFFTVIAFEVVYLFTAELIPTGVRSVGIGICFCVSRIGAMISPFINLLVREQLALYVCVIYIFIHLYTCLSVFLSIYLPTCYMYVCIYVYLSIHPSIHLSIYLSIYVCMDMYVYSYVSVRDYFIERNLVRCLAVVLLDFEQYCQY